MAGETTGGIRTEEPLVAVAPALPGVVDGERSASTITQPPPAETTNVENAAQPASDPSAAPTAGRRRRWAVAQLCGLLAVAYLALFHVSVVRGSSMAPGIHDGDRIVVDHFAYLLGDVERGDVVVLKYPLDPSLDYIKRVIGLPGDEVMIDHGEVWVNGERLSEPYVESADPLSRLYVRVQPAHFFVLGDNRPRSSDSREFGQVPMDYVRGRVEVRLWPLSRIGTIQ